MLAEVGEELPCDAERVDVPTLKHFLVNYECAKKGLPYTSVPHQFKTGDRQGGNAYTGRRSRWTAAKIADAFAYVLTEDAAAILDKATHISMTKDSRQGFVVLRVRCVMGDGLPANFVPMPDLCDSDGDLPNTVGVATALRRDIVVVDLVLDFIKKKPYENVVDKAQSMRDCLERVLRGGLAPDVDKDAVIDRVTQKVRAFCPDGAPDEQLSGRLATEHFDNLEIVLRCTTHAIHGALKDAWKSDAEVKRITKVIVDEVSKFLKYSDRFQQRFSSKAQAEIFEAVHNFSYAPQRFGSRSNTFQRFVLFMDSILLVLADELAAPSSAVRKKWARAILQELTGETWLLIGCLADLATDVEEFIRFFDVTAPDPIEGSQKIISFLRLIRTRYENGALFKKRQTYTEHVWKVLEGTRILQSQEGIFIIERPTAEARNRCAARIANLGDAFAHALLAEVPECSPLALCSALRLPKSLGEDDGGLAPTPPATKCQQLGLMARYLKWPAAQEDRLVQEFTEAWPRATRFYVADANTTHLDAWCREAAQLPKDSPLREIVLLYPLCFLYSESQCERDFAKDLAAIGTKRVRMGAHRRYGTLKIVADGLPADYVAQADQPRTTFLKRAQDAYAKLFGSRVVRNLRPRKDRGHKRAAPPDKPSGSRKDTVTAFKSRRRLAMRRRIRKDGSPTHMTVFEDAELDAAEIQRVRAELRDENDFFKKTLAKADKKLEEKRQQAEALGHRRPDALKWSEISRKKRQQVLKRIHGMQRKMRANLFRGTAASRVTFARLKCLLGGAPLVHIDSARRLEGRGLDEVLAPGATLQTFAYESGQPGVERLCNFCMHGEAWGRRIFLVPRLSETRPAIKVAAAFMGARIQQQLLNLALRFVAKSPVAGVGGLPPCGCSWSKAFAKAHAEVVQVLRALASNQQVGLGVYLKLNDFEAAIAAKTDEKHKGRAWKRQWTYLYMETEKPPDSVLSFARGLAEFIDSFAAQSSGLR